MLTCASKGSISPVGRATHVSSEYTDSLRRSVCNDLTNTNGNRGHLAVLNDGVNLVLDSPRPTLVTHGRTAWGFHLFDYKFVNFSNI